MLAETLIRELQKVHPKSVVRIAYGDSEYGPTVTRIQAIKIDEQLAVVCLETPEAAGENYDYLS